jgi:hypothetical protein
MLHVVKKPDNPSGTDPKERRQYPRYAISATAEAVDVQSDTRIHGRVSDIGRGGCYVETMSPFPVGAIVKLKVTKDDKSFAAGARVLYSTGGMGMGVIFTEIEPSQAQVLERWLAELSGEPLPEAKPPSKEPEPQPEPGGPSTETRIDEQRYVLNELIIALIRKRVLTDAEGKALLLKLMS